MAVECVTVYRPTGAEELKLVVESGYMRWPPRLPGQPYFYPVAEESYAREIAEQWNVPAGGVGYVLRFQVRREFLERYPIHQAGARRHQEWWIPAEDLSLLNENIVGKIEVVGEFK